MPLSQSLGQDVDLDLGLTIHLDFNANMKDLTGVHRDGELLGACYAMDRFGNCEFALGFDGYLQLARVDEAAMDGLQDFSVSLWLRHEGDAFGTFLSVANRDRNNEFNLNILNGGNLGSNIRNIEGRPGIIIDANSNISDGEWHHVVLTRDGSSGDTFIYVDKAQDGFKNMPLGQIEVGQGGFVFGNDQDCLAGCYSSGQQMLGEIDDFRVYDRVINSDEISALFDYTDGIIDTKVRGGVRDVFSCEDNVTLSAERNYDSFNWNNGSSQSSIEVNADGQYILTGMIKDCEYKDTVNVTFDSLPELIVLSDGDDLSCNNTITLTASEGFDTYTWQDGTQSQTLEVTQPGRYFVRGIATCGESVSQEIEIVRSEIPTLEIETFSETIACGERVTLLATEGFITYEWTTGETTRDYVVSQPGLYEVSVTDHCGGEQTLSITISEEMPEPYFLPNAFTPNQDGKNDTFIIDDRLVGSRLKVVDRWGKLVFESQSYTNDWDGNRLNAGTYYVFIDGFCLPEPIKYWVQLIR